MRTLKRWLRRVGIGLALLALALTFSSLVFNLATAGREVAPQQLYPGPFARVDGTDLAYRKWGSHGSPVLLLGGFIPTFEVPFWVMLACSTTITLGILSGGWQIVRTLGFSIYKIRPLHALDSQMTSASVIFTSSLIGAPVSTTHVVASSIMGIGASERPKAVRWTKAREIVTTWVITIPGAALMSISCYLVVRAFI